MAAFSDPRGCFVHHCLPLHPLFILRENVRNIIPSCTALQHQKLHRTRLLQPAGLRNIMTTMSLEPGVAQSRASKGLLHTRPYFHHVVLFYAVLRRRRLYPLDLQATTLQKPKRGLSWLLLPPSPVLRPQLRNCLTWLGSTIHVSDSNETS